MFPRIDVRMSNARKAYVGELSFEYEGDNGLIDLPETKFSSPVKVSLRYEIFEDDTVDVTGSVRFSLEGPCSRCLSPVSQEVVAEVDACFEPGEGDGETYGYQNGVVVLDELLRDTVLIALPSSLVCENACELPEWNN